MDDKTPRFELIAKDLVQYINLRIDGLKLGTAKSGSIFFGVAITVFLGILLANFALLFFLAALTYWLGDVLGSMPVALLITGGFYVLMLVILLVGRKKLITNRLVALFCKLLFENVGKEPRQKEEEYDYE